MSDWKDGVLTYHLTVMGKSGKGVYFFGGDDNGVINFLLDVYLRCPMDIWCCETGAEETRTRYAVTQQLNLLNSYYVPDAVLGIFQ